MTSAFHSRRFPASLLAVGALLLAASGCGRTGSVSGVVRMQGEPVAGGSVILYCQNEQIVQGIIGPDGSYSIPNVPAGVARVTVRVHPPVPKGLALRQQLPPSIGGPILPQASDEPGATPVPIPERYAVPEESGLTLVVGRKNQTFNIDLQP